ncbi:MAG: hypothetical protein IKI57_03590 [Clostridia bacterium]|nr:hypothetical protein [Clostridia bacterium]
MRKFIAYDKDTYRILGFISNDYIDISQTEEVFKNFENYEVIETDAIQVPPLFDNYRLKFEEGILIGIEEIPEPEPETEVVNDG